MKRGNIVLFVAQGDMGKPRPGAIVQADELGETTTSVLICPMSSDLSDVKFTRPVVQPDVSNGLRITSQIMTDKLFALKRERIRRLLGSLDSSALESLDRALLVVLGLSK